LTWTLPICARVTRIPVAYLKLFVADALIKEKRVCLLGCDIVVEDDLAILFDTALDGKAIGCVAESVFGHSAERDYRASQGFLWYEDYYNCGGVLLIDVERSGKRN
jgi:lipopolysaccharide biosynthesis glycosyltransferase